MVPVRADPSLHQPVFGCLSLTQIMNSPRFFCFTAQLLLEFGRFDIVAIKTAVHTTQDLLPLVSAEAVNSFACHGESVPSAASPASPAIHTPLAKDGYPAKIPLPTPRSPPCSPSWGFGRAISVDTLPPGDCRGKTILCTLGKTFCEILRYRMGTLIEKKECSSEGQAGFWSKSSCVDHPCTLGKTIQRRKYEGLTTNCLFLDVLKAYDTV